MDTIEKTVQNIGIVILNYNNYKDTIKCLKTLIEHSIKNMPLVVIVDNFSSNDSVRKIGDFIVSEGMKLEFHTENNKIEEETRFIIIKTNKNLGYAGGNNVGLKFLINNQVEIICILNNDIIFTNNTVQELVVCLNKHPEIGFLSPMLLKPNGEIDYNCCRKNPTYSNLIFESINFLNLKILHDIIESKYILKTGNEIINQEIVKCDILSGACIIAKRSTWETIQCFDPNTFLYYEENILYEKLKRKTGLKSAIYTKVTAVHIGAQSTSKLKNTKLLRIEIESLKYYLKTYRNKNFIGYFLLLAIKYSLLAAVELKNRLT